MPRWMNPQGIGTPILRLWLRCVFPAWRFQRRTQAEHVREKPIEMECVISSADTAAVVLSIPKLIAQNAEPHSGPAAKSERVSIPKMLNNNTSGGRHVKCAMPLVPDRGRASRIFDDCWQFCFGPGVTALRSPLQGPPMVGRQEVSVPWAYFFFLQFPMPFAYFPRT